MKNISRNWFKYLLDFLPGKSQFSGLLREKMRKTESCVRRSEGDWRIKFCIIAAPREQHFWTNSHSIVERNKTEQITLNNVYSEVQQIFKLKSPSSNINVVRTHLRGSLSLGLYFEIYYKLSLMLTSSERWGIVQGAAKLLCFLKISDL